MWRLLTGPGVVWELKFGSWVLLQPERINAYAQAVIQTLRADEFERGCLPEERVLNGDLTYHSSMQRLEPEEERFVLLAMHQTLVERGLCLREQTDKGPLLIFPSYLPARAPGTRRAPGRISELPLHRIPGRHLRHAGGTAAPHQGVSAGPTVALRRRFQNASPGNNWASS